MKIPALLFLIALSYAPVFAQQQIRNKDGKAFMDELPEQEPRQEIKTEDGSLFMEELPTPKKAVR
ncbi:MAG: hypothetical protein K2X27_03350, partial [Candidatus Obscuribacterales bacterium]|nr:hypothetical protein [Candidatus Obscuribacterales bacterium]